MLEDLPMDKKLASGSRPSQHLAKQGPSNTDFKKLQVQDGINAAKGFQRSPKKREGAGPAPSKNDQHRQRGKAYDKRPRPRYQHNDDRKEDSQVEECRAEFDSVLSLGSKKVNLNHLLNFHYLPKDVGANGRHSGPKNWRQSTQRHRFNKEEFLQAKCQFVVRSGGDYSRYMNDPDTLVEWDMIEQIRIFSSEHLCCPICLCLPTAPRITKCGHVYCWPCILHYLALGDTSSRTCPLCFESVCKDDLKSVTSIHHDEFKVGDIVNLRLMKRERGSLAVSLVGDEAGVQDLPISDAAFPNPHCKLLMADPSEILSIIETETSDLLERLRDEEGTPEICFTEQAIEFLNQRRTFIASGDLQSEGLGNADNEQKVFPLQYYAETENKERRQDSVSEGNIDDPLKELSSPECDLAAADSENKNKKFYYFYQAEDGQYLFLHALNVHMLEHMYGSLEQSPTSIKGRIVEKESGSMTTELRQRLRYLQHLPVRCQFELVELEFRPPLVSKETLEFFREQVDARKKKRNRRARDETKREKRILEEENQRLGRFPSPNVSIESHQHFPECGISNSPPLRPSFQVGEDVLEAASPPAVEKSGPSFSQMLSQGKQQGASAWGKRVHESVSMPQIGKAVIDPEMAELEGYVPAPSFSQSFGDAFALALQQVENEACTPTGENTGRKKKKNKQKLLLSTNMAYNSKQ